MSQSRAAATSSPSSSLTVLELDDERWQEFVESSGTSVFHHPSWPKLLAECYGYRCFAAAVTDEQGRITAGLPLMEVKTPLRRRRRWISLPFTDYCPPIVAAGENGNRLAAELRRAQSEAGLTEVEIRAELDGTSSSRQVLGYRHTLALEEDTDAVFRSFGRSQVQRRIESAVERGVVIETGKEVSDLDSVFYGLHLLTRRRLGVPIQPKRFFSLLWERLLQEGLGFVLLAYVEGRPVAGAVFLAWKDSVIYKFGASDHHAKLRPNNLVIWRGIEWGCERGYGTFDFGRTDFGAEGLRRFKNGWNPVEEPLVYTTLGTEVQGSSAGVAERALGTVIRHSPLWVCRALGETLYRYAA